VLDWECSRGEYDRASIGRHGAASHERVDVSESVGSAAVIKSKQSGAASQDSLLAWGRHRGLKVYESWCTVKMPLFRCRTRSFADMPDRRLRSSDLLGLLAATIVKLTFGTVPIKNEIRGIRARYQRRDCVGHASGFREKDERVLCVARQFHRHE
jgi:hypothetical protein